MKYFSERDFKTTAIDISSEIIRNTKMVSPTSVSIHSDFFGYDFGSERFSGVFAENVLHLFPKDKITGVFDKIYGLLDERDIFYFLIPLFDSFREEIISRGKKNFVLEFRTRYIKDNIEQIMRDSRFKTIEEKVTQFRDTKGNNLSRLNALLVK